MESDWVVNVFEQGLLNWDVGLSAHLHGFPAEQGWLTNDVAFGKASLAGIDPGTGRWFKLPYIIPTNGLSFPYGRDVD